MERSVSLDICRLILTIMVVGLHVGLLHEYNELISFLLVDGLFRISVPIFFIINGFYFYKVVENGGVRRWLFRMLGLYVVWMLFYMPFWMNVSELSGETAKDLITKIFFGYYHLWYVAGTLYAGALLYVVRKYDHFYMVVMSTTLFLIGVFIQYSGNYGVFEVLSIAKYFNYDFFHRNFLFFAFPFVSLGFLINKFTIYKELSSSAVYFFVIVGFILLMTESYFNGSNQNRVGGFDNYLSLVVVAPAVFLACLKNKIPAPKNTKFIATYCSSVYFIHVFVLFEARNYFLLNSIALFVFVLVVSAVLSVGLVGLNKKLKFIL